MMKSDGNGGTQISYANPKQILIILGIVAVIWGSATFFVGQANAQSNHEDRISKNEDTLNVLGKNFVPRAEMDTNMKLVAEQYNRLEGKIDVTDTRIVRVEDLLITYMVGYDGTSEEFYERE